MLHVATLPHSICGAQQGSVATRGQGGALAWPGLLRRLDRLDPSFRT